MRSLHQFSYDYNLDSKTTVIVTNCLILYVIEIILFVIMVSPLIDVKIIHVVVIVLYSLHSVSIVFKNVVIIVKDNY